MTQTDESSESDQLKKDSAVTEGEIPSSQKPRKSKKPKQAKFLPKSASDLLELAYVNQRALRELSANQIEEVSFVAGQDKITSAWFEDKVKMDPYLNVPPLLLSLISNLPKKSEVRVFLVAQMREVLVIHPAFKLVKDKISNPNLLNELSSSDIRRSVSDVSFVELGLDSSATFSKSSRETLKVNAITTFELLCFLEDTWSAVDVILDRVESVWKSQVRKRPSQPIAKIMVSKDPVGIASIANLLADEIANLNYACKSIRHDLDQTKNALINTQQQLESLEIQIEREVSKSEQLEIEKAEISAALDSERENRKQDTLHSNDGYESLRRSVIKRLNDQVELLEKSQHALRNGRHDIAEEFVERVFQAINSTLKKLEE